MPHLGQGAVEEPNYSHLLRLTDRRGIFEHAEFLMPRQAHGYCSDDVSRALVVLLRVKRPTTQLRAAADTYLKFLEVAVSVNGAVHNRMDTSGAWTDEPATGDAWGRTVAALGLATRLGATPLLRRRAGRAFRRAAVARTAHVRAGSFAAIGAAELVGGAYPGEASVARDLLIHCLGLVPRHAIDGWGWPEPRLRYANAALCDALIVGGAALGQAADIRQGLTLLAVLLEIETSPEGHFSVTGSHGRGPGDIGPLWDQQPIELAAIADACAHAYAVTGSDVWRSGVERSWSWFVGGNDTGVTIYDADTGAGHDGLEPTGRNENCGAESTLAALSTLQRLREVAEPAA